METTTNHILDTGNRILLAGCGGIGRPLALQLAQHHQVWALARHPETLPQMIQYLQGDVCDLQSLIKVVPDHIDYLVVCLSAGEFSDTAYRQIYVEGLKNLLEALQRRGTRLKRLFFVSSTSVYHQNNNEWVDETSATHPDSFSGLRMLEAEQVALNAPWPATIVRFSGIYGGTRTRLLNQVKAGVRSPSGDAFTNRIHEKDCVGVLAHLLKLDMTGKPVENCYLASDCQPVQMNTLETWLAQTLDCELSPPETLARANSIRRAGSKRCRNKRLLDSGYQFQYPDFKAGYQEMIALC
ncbi:MAG: SDR family oxidoreductase [Hahellaceae bacterium]|nr:SDR family oxidoreductase [Hahellaceae bacterium]MCP5168463.1 SDR family oxidoreductase [Hahellaceae bacterium]